MFLCKMRIFVEVASSMMKKIVLIIFIVSTVISCDRSELNLFEGETINNGPLSALGTPLEEPSPAPTTMYGRSSHAAVAHNGKIYYLGGWYTFGDKYNYPFVIYDTNPSNSNPWTINHNCPPHLKPAVSPSLGHAGLSANLINGKIYIFGGANIETGPAASYLNKFYEYDIISDTWQEITTDTGRPGPRAWHTSVTIDNKIYIWGGKLSAQIPTPIDESYDNLYVYNPATKIWNEIINNDPGKPLARHFHAATSYNNKMYIFGGSASDKSLYIYDISTNTWSNISPVISKSPEELEGSQMLVSNKKLYIFGGATGVANPVDSNIYVFNLTSNTWEEPITNITLTNLVPRAWHTFIQHNELIYIFGGLPWYTNPNSLIKIRL
jgi:N-acetylneuraminic acid mutarotase